MTQDLYETGGVIKQGRLMVEGREVFRQALARFADGPITLRITAGKRPRSLAQNAYWWSVVVPLFSEHCGYEKQQMHDALALELIPQEAVNMKTGEVVTVPGHTSQLSVSEFNDLIERAQRLGAEMQIYIPDPNEVAV